ncbi:uncharacterized protein Dwil_GK26892 [Drosophila willistoni]|uniref:Uncharacterized protein n=1 Tax=Drosophila willistoni TaxID=7260 RepID=A0A0Q9WYU5_DROWI|nr:uncharacterized protein LOC26528894 [Drosophila willistoni]KRF97580.1 uncharacterized protein Dwil_GK26892 [Drosophila willistoni]
MYINADKGKLILAGIAVAAFGLALGSFAIQYWIVDALQVSRVVELTMSGLLLFGIYGAEDRHKKPILLTWIISTIVFCHVLLFVLDKAYVGEVIYVIITEVLLVGMMYIVYRAYCELDSEPDLGWTHTSFPRNPGFQLSLKSVDVTPKEAKQSEMTQPPPYEEQNIPNASVY